MAGKVSSDIVDGVGADGRVLVEVVVVDDFGEIYAVLLYGVEGQEGMADGAELAVGDYYSGKVVVLDVVDGQIFSF